MAVTRFEDWPKRLRAEIAMAQGLPFAWGSHDCALFACRVIEAMTGIDPAEHLRGTYGSEGEARFIIQENGGSLEAMTTEIMAAHGFPAVAPRFAQRGDMILANTLAGPALGICVGHEAIFAGPRGIARLPIIPTAIAAWRV